MTERKVYIILTILLSLVLLPISKALGLISATWTGVLVPSCIFLAFYIFFGLLYYINKRREK